MTVGLYLPITDTKAMASSIDPNDIYIYVYIYRYIIEKVQTRVIFATMVSWM